MTDYLQEIISESLKQFGLQESPLVHIEAPKDPTHGDASTNIAMVLAKPLSNNPRAIAQMIVEGLKYDGKKISEVTIAGPGFINFRYAYTYLYDELDAILKKGKDFGKTDAFKNKKILIEFVSANPTGPLTVGHGRNAVLGDTFARLLEWTGAEVQREYYFNDAGRQIRVLGQSVQARYLEALGKTATLPEGGYEGDYIREIAAEVINERGEALVNSEEWTPFTEKAKDVIFADINATLKRMEIHMDSYFNEHTLYEDGSIDAVVKEFTEKGLAYEKEGATWFKTTEFGKETDTVLIKSSGEPTYRLPDIAYHKNKLDRGYDLCVDVFGADHIATYPDVLSGIESLGYDSKKVDVIVYQFVTIVKDGKPFKMSTRKANFITLDELMDEVGPDVTRFFFLMRSPNTHLEFDIAQAKEAGDKNPVFYLQYAHARIKSILSKAEEEIASVATIKLELLTHKSELDLIKAILKLPEAIESAATSKEPHRLINFLNDVASNFTSFYHDCRIIGEDDSLAHARIQLAKATAQVLKNGLTILGISAPEKM